MIRRFVSISFFYNLALFLGKQDVQELQIGIGIHKTPSYRYDGFWLDDKRHGWGLCSEFDEELGYRIVYDGEWAHGKPTGQGTRQYSNQGYYNGDWKSGARDGFGEMWYANGDYYAGQWLKNLRHGIGVYVFSQYSNTFLYNAYEMLPYVLNRNFQLPQFACINSSGGS